MVNNLSTPILEGGIKSIYFFNGRLLSAEDLRQEQAAHRAGHQLLGQAIGDGVGYGLEVKPSPDNTPTQPVINVTDGLAVNRLGQILVLSQGSKGTDVVLARPTTNGSPAGSGLFADCKEKLPGAYVVGAGVYLLTIGPASGKKERAPVSGLGNIEAACNARYEVAGVQFRLIQLNLSPNDLADANHLRNRVAHLCFGTGDPKVNNFISNPFGSIVKGYGLLDDLRPDCLTDAEVPLAVIYWTVAEGIKFVDRWAVRRRLTRPSADAAWPLLIADRRAAEGEAMFLQFQEQVQDVILGEKNPESIIATQRFDYLPPVGVLPLTAGNRLKGFDEQRFFEGLTYRPSEFIEGAQLYALIRTAALYPALELKSGVMLWLYRVRENIQTIDQRLPTLPQEYLVFTSGHMPYFGDGRYNVNRWVYGNFA
jgi:hypothetical protein